MQRSLQQSSLAIEGSVSRLHASVERDGTHSVDQSSASVDDDLLVDDGGLAIDEHRAAPDLPVRLLGDGIERDGSLQLRFVHSAEVELRAGCIIREEERKHVVSERGWCAGVEL